MTLITLLTIILYLLTAFLLGRRLAHGVAALEQPKTAYLALGIGGLVLHASVVYNNVFTTGGLNMGFYNAMSLITWMVALIILLASIKRPLENLAIVVLPLASLALLLELNLDSRHVFSVESELKYHILFSIIAYSLLSVAAVQAILLSVQDYHLRHKHPAGFVRALPPLQDMETLLFQLIGIGFVFLSLALFSGFVFLQDMFAQHLVHKTILSILAWVIFAILLWGRWRFGWRGRKAIRWTLTGFVILLLAYAGSKFVLEIVLNR
jgi:ABC-type uncharacterized transport system permease subunit